MTFQTRPCLWPELPRQAPRPSALLPTLSWQGAQDNLSGERQEGCAAWDALPLKTWDPHSYRRSPGVHAQGGLGHAGAPEAVVGGAGPLAHGKPPSHSLPEASRECNGLCAATLLPCWGGQGREALLLAGRGE